MTLKDQSGVSASAEWLSDHGHSRQSPRRRRRSESDVTERVTFDHWETVTDFGRCLRCSSTISPKENPVTGGTFHICSACGWYISYRVADGCGRQVKLEEKR